MTLDQRDDTFDAVIVGGGPAGATAAHDLALKGWRVALLDRAGRIKPCGGAIPPRLLKDFAIPEHLLVARARAARIVSPSDRAVDMPVDSGGFVGMVDRDVFDEWLRVRAADAGAVRIDGRFESLERDADGTAVIAYRPKGAAEGTLMRVRGRKIIGADGANSQVARSALPKIRPPKLVFAYHEVIKAPAGSSGAYDGTRCDIYYKGYLSPDFYAWIFPHGEHASVGTGSAHKGFSLRNATQALREIAGLAGCETVRVEGAPIPLRPMSRWDNGRDVVLAGDAAGVVAPASGEGIYYAMTGGRLAADAVNAALETGDARALAGARKAFMKLHGMTFRILGIMQYFWYGSDAMRERFVAMCADKDVQRLTWQGYMDKKIVYADPLAHVKIFFKDLGHLLGVAKAS